MKLLNVFLFILLVNCYNAQAQSGIIKYVCTRDMTEYKMSFPDDKTPEDTTKHIKVGNQKMKIENLLLFSKNEISFFYTPSEQTINTEMVKKIQHYQNLDTKILISLERSKGKSYLTLDTMVKISWKLSKNTKKIQNIECFSAQTEYRGRVWTAWYAPSIPISSGPWKLYGLPGMILEAKDEGSFTHFECTYISIPQSIKFEMEVPKAINNTDKPISTKQYARFVENDLNNFEKMSTSNEGSQAFGVPNIEIFEFEKNITMKRIQQKLSDISKK